MFLGAESISFAEFVKSIRTLFSSSGEQLKGTNAIIWKIRIPRIFLTILVGAALSTSGVVFQGVFKNPMADPYLLGVSAGAVFGITIARLLQSGSIGLVSISTAAFLGGTAASLIVFLIAGGFRVRNTVYLLLTGIAFGFLLSGLVSLLIYLNKEKAEDIIFWTMGSFSQPTWDKVLVILLILIPSYFVMRLFAKDLNIMSLGEEHAASVGMNVISIRLVLLLTATIVTAAAVAVSGIVAFVGLIIPHSMRFFTGADHRKLLPASLLCGASFLMLADTIARTILAPTLLPVGIITSLIGAPYFIYLVFRRRALWQ